MDGIAVMQPTFRGGEMGQIQEGDQVGPGQLFMKIVDPKSMQLEARANQAESSDLRIGQHVTVRLDAFPDLALPGSVYSIGALATGGWTQNYYIRSVPVTITIEGTNPHLIPDLSGSGDVSTAQAENVLAVPRTAVRQTNGQAFVFVRDGNRFVQRPVTLGFANESHIAITGGLKAGEEVRLD
jgi:HlyD family secretion protein